MLKKTLLVLLIALTAAGCAQKGQAPASNNLVAAPPAQTVELLISAAASLTDSLKEIQTLFENEQNPIKLTFNLGASGSLQQQIEQGAPADIFLSAGKKQMSALVDKQLIEPDQQMNLLANELVMIVPKDSTLAISKLEHITNPEVKMIAIGQPESVPIGSYTKDSLAFYKLWDSIQSKTVFAKDVRQVLHYVETGNTEVGFVYKTDALTSDKVKIILTVDPSSHKAIEYPIGIVKATKHLVEAQLFYSFLQTKEAQDVFKKYGFNLPQ